MSEVPPCIFLWGISYAKQSRYSLTWFIFPNLIQSKVRYRSLQNYSTNNSSYCVNVLNWTLHAKKKAFLVNWWERYQFISLFFNEGEKWIIPFEKGTFITFVATFHNIHVVHINSSNHIYCLSLEKWKSRASAE